MFRFRQRARDTDTLIIQLDSCDAFIRRPRPTHPPSISEGSRPESNISRIRVASDVGHCFAYGVVNVDPRSEWLTDEAFQLSPESVGGSSFMESTGLKGQCLDFRAG